MRAMSRRTSLDARRAFELVGRRLEAEVEGLASGRRVGDQLVVALRAQISNLGHYSPPRWLVSPRRATLGLDRQLHRRAAEAPAASGPVTPSSSNRILPKADRADQYSTEPLPLP